MEFKDYYKALGVAREAGADEIKRAYRKLARRYHPDVSREKNAQARMQEVNEAYAVLSDPKKRAAYDRAGQGFQGGQEFRPPPGWNANQEFSEREFTADEAAGFSDFFSELFGRMRRGPGGRYAAGGESFAQRGADQHARVELEVEDSFTGAERQLTLQMPRLDAQSGHVAFETRTLNVKIPKGIREGQVIRLAGQGNPGIGGGAAGDLLLEVRFRPHPWLTPEGRDIRMNLPVAPWEAALGAVVPVDLPTGRLNVRIPPGAGSDAARGRELRVRGHGIPSNPPGDLLIDVRIIAPAADSPRERELYEQLRRESDFDPRGELKRQA